MGTIKRLNEARKAQKDAENAMPGAYQSQYKGRINETLDAMGGAGADNAVDTLLDKAYQQYRQLTGQNAAAAAQNAVDVTNGLAGGYGSDWAGNVAQQGYNEAMAAVDDAMPGLRAKALNQYQNQQNDLADRLSALMNQESMAQNQYNGSVADAENMRDYRQSRTNMAKQENTSFWNNVWNSVKNVGSAALNAYDTYKGYAQQQWENEFAEKQFEAEQERMATNKAFELYKDGYVTAADQLLQPYGKTSDIFTKADNAQTTFESQMEGLQEVISLASRDQIAAAKWVANYYNLPEGLIDYSVYSQPTSGYSGKSRSYSGSSGSGRSSSGSSGSSGVNNHGYTNSQLLQMSKTYSSMKDSDPQKGYYKQVLTDAGYMEPETVSGTTGTLTAPLAVEPYTPASSKLRLSNTGNHTTQKATSGQTISRAQVAANAAKGQWEKGADMKTIYNSLRLQGYSEAEIEQALNALE